MVKKSDNLNKIEHQNGVLSCVAFFGDIVLRYAAGVFVAAKCVRKDILDINNIDKPLRFFDTYKRYYNEYTGENAWRMTRWANQFADARIAKYQDKQQTKYKPDVEIMSKNLGHIIYGLNENDFLNVSFFEQTEHQPHSPRTCSYGKYVIEFSSTGTTWCNGIQGNGYIFERDTRGNLTQIATISPALSEYLSKIALEKYKHQTKLMMDSRTQ